MRYTMYGLALLSVLLVSGMAIEALADAGYHEMKEQVLQIVNAHKS
mgnify:CR=1 FL=1